MENLINNDLDPSSFDDETDSETEPDNKPDYESNSKTGNE